MNYEIPILGGAENAHQELTAQLGENVLEIVLDYQQSGKWSANLTLDGKKVASGMTLEVNADIFRYRVEGLGSLALFGEDTTLDNLGRSNRLVWIPPS